MFELSAVYYGEAESHDLMAETLREICNTVQSDAKTLLPVSNIEIEQNGNDTYDYRITLAWNGDPDVVTKNLYDFVQDWTPESISVKKLW